MNTVETTSSIASIQDPELSEVKRALAAARDQVAVEIERRLRAERDYEQLFAEHRSQLRRQLHDGLGQVLTSISFLATSLSGKLQRQGVSDRSELDEILSLVSQAISESRAIAAQCDTTPRESLIGQSLQR